MKKHWIFKITGALILALGLASASRAQPVERLLDPNDPIYKTVAVVLPIDGPNSFHGNGVLLGGEGCFVATNAHVAFGIDVVKSELYNPKTKKTELVEVVMFVPKEQQRVGHRVDVIFDYDHKSGKFKQRRTARVVAMVDGFNGAYITTFKEDRILLEFEHCETKPALPGLPPMRYDFEKGYPRQRSESFSRVYAVLEEDGFKIYEETGCSGLPFQRHQGLYLSDCGSKPGQSGSATYFTDSFGQRTFAGLNQGTITYESGVKRTITVAGNKIIELLRGISLAPQIELESDRIADLYSRSAKPRAEAGPTSRPSTAP